MGAVQIQYCWCCWKASFSTEMELFIVIFGVTEIKSLYSYGMIFLSQDLKMFVIIFIRLKTVRVEKNTLIRPLFSNPNGSYPTLHYLTLHYLTMNIFPYENVTWVKFFLTVQSEYFHSVFILFLENRIWAQMGVILWVCSKRRDGTF